MTWLRFAPALSLVVSGSALAAPRDGYIQQSIVNTVAKSLDRRGVTDATIRANTLSKVNAEVTQQANAQSGTPKTWYHPLKNMIGALAPSPLGKRGAAYMFPANGTTEEKQNYCQAVSNLWTVNDDGSGCKGSGGYGGGGATMKGDYPSIPESGGDAGVRDCGDMGFGFAIDGSFIIPSYVLQVGGAVKPIDFPNQNDPEALYHRTTPIGGTATVNMPGGSGNGAANFTANNEQAVLLWAVHKYNLSRDKRDWLGVMGKSAGQWWFSTVPRAGVARQLFAKGVLTPGYYYKPLTGCPDGGNAGGSFHFYGDSQGATVSPPSNVWTNCVWYSPTSSLGLGGYAINPHATVTFDTGWQQWLYPFQKACGLDPEFIRRLSEEMLNRASGRAGYNGVTPAPVEYNDVRGTPTVEDLADDPTTGAQPATTTQDVNDPAPSPPPSSTPSSSGFQDECDFGAGGCDNPNTAAPTLEEPNTSIMDPVFDWLPDLPSITIPDMSSQCPTWSLNLTEYGGPNWQFLIDKHCALMAMDIAGHGSVAGAIGVLIVGLVGFWAVRHILSA